MRPHIKITIAAIGILFITAHCYAQNAAPGWKTYTSSQYGFSFQYPGNWVMDDDKDVIVSGAVASRSIHFIDKVSKTFLLISYSLSKGPEIYNFYITNYDASRNKHIKVDGRDAIQITTLDNRTGRGRLLNKKDWGKEIDIEFLDKKKTGALELKFWAHQNSSLAGEMKKLNQLVQSFKL